MLSQMSLLDNITPAAVAWGLVSVSLFLFASRVLLSRRRPSCRPHLGDTLLPSNDFLGDEYDKYIDLSSSFKLSKLPLPKEPSETGKKVKKKARKMVKEFHRRPKSNARKDKVANPGPPVQNLWPEVLLGPAVNPNAHKDNALNFGPPVVNLEPFVPNLDLETIYQPDLFGMKNYELDVLKFLKYGTASFLGIYGMRGVGKTTLMRLVYPSTRRDRSFHYVFFVDAGIGFTPDILEGILARNVGLSLLPTVPTHKLLCSFLRDESFVLFIDDVRAIFDLAAAGLPMPLGPRQKIIFTTRNESICAKMGTAGNIVRMQCLEEEVAWDLFKYNVGAEIIDSNSGIEDIAKQMVAECRGYPGAICTIARSMSTKTDLSQWMIAYEMLNIKRSSLHEIEEADSEGYPCLDFFEDELGFLSKMIMAGI